MEFFKIRRVIPFMRHALVFNIISLLTFVAAVGFLAFKGLNYSIEFTGGILMEVNYTDAADVEHIRNTLEKAGIKAEVQNFGSSRDVLIRLHVEKGKASSDTSEIVLFTLASPSFKGKTSASVADGESRIEIEYEGQKKLADVKAVVDAHNFSGTAVDELTPGRKFSVRVPLQKDAKLSQQELAEKIARVLVIAEYDGKTRRIEFVGPQVGEELAQDGALALLVTILGIVAYLAIRFEWKFGIAAIIANLHDVVIILGFFALFQWEFSLPVLAAVLAVLGYSVNESVVVFDRVRENFRKMRKAPVSEVIDTAITGVISRTIITHGCTQAMVTTMLLFGGPALHYFALALTIGICFGIYSSVLVAAPLLMWLKVDRSMFVRASKKDSAQDKNEGAVV